MIREFATGPLPDFVGALLFLLVGVIDPRIFFIAWIILLLGLRWS